MEAGGFAGPLGGFQRVNLPTGTLGACLEHTLEIVGRVLW